MISLILLSLLLAIAYCRPTYKKNLLTDGAYLTHDRTCFINGFYGVFVFVSHLLQSNITPSLADKICLHLLPRGQLMVTTFFFFSGYGLMCSLLKKGRGYSGKLLLHRLPKILLQLIFTVLICWAAEVNVMGAHYSVSHVLLSLIAWQDIGSTNWYICETMMYYFVIAVPALLFGLSCLKRYLVIVWSLSALMLLVLTMVKTGEDAYWVNTPLCLPLGMTYCVYRERIEAALASCRWPTIAVAAVLIILGLVLHRKVGGVATFGNIGSMLYVLGICFAQGCFTIRRTIPFLSWVGGAALIFCYTLQRLPMNLLSYWGLDSFSRELYVLCALLCTLALAYTATMLFRYLFRWMFRENCLAASPRGEGASEISG